MCFESKFQVKTENKKQGGGVGLGSRWVAAVSAPYKGDGCTHEWDYGCPFYTFIVGGCQWQRALMECRRHAMWCRGLDAHWLHRTMNLMSRATFLWTDSLHLMRPWKCSAAAKLCHKVSLNGMPEICQKAVDIIGSGAQWRDSLQRSSEEIIWHDRKRTRQLD